jgi:hypothetical protein
MSASATCLLPGVDPAATPEASNPSSAMLLSELPDELVQLIAAELDAAALCDAQLACSGWRVAFGRAVLRLQPRQLPAAGGALVRRFPNLQSLDLSRCVGSMVPDESVRALSDLTLLTSLCLKGCGKVSAEAFGALSTLTLLERLDLTGCKVRLLGVSQAGRAAGCKIGWACC